MKNLTAKIQKNYQGLASGLISLYFLCALEVSTMLRYQPLVSTASKALRYLIYVALIVLWASGFCRSEQIRNWKQFGHRLSVWLINHLMSVLIGITSVLIYLSSGSLIPLALLLMYLVLQYCSTDQVLKWIFYTQAAASLIVIGLSFAGVIDNLAYLAFLRGTRYSLGYIFPLELHAHFLALSLLYLYLFPKQHGWKSFLLISLLNFALYRFTIARTSFALAEAAAVLSLIAALIPAQNKDRLCGWKGWKRAVPWLTLLVFVSFIVICLLYNPHELIWERIDDMFSGRLRLGQAALENYPLTLFGQRVEWIGSGGPEGVYVWENSYNFVDNAYIKDLIDNGLVFWILEILGFIWLQLHFLKERRLMDFFIVWVFFALGMMEPRLILLPFSFLLLLFETPALSSNAAVETWFSQTFGSGQAWKRMPVWKKAAIGACAALSGGFLLVQLRQIRISSARKSFASDLLSHRTDYATDLWMTDQPAAADPVRLRKLLLEGVDTTDGYEAAVMEIQSAQKDESMSDEDFALISDLNEQKTEQAYLQIRDADQTIDEKRLNEIEQQIADVRKENENNEKTDN